MVLIPIDVKVSQEFKYVASFSINAINSGNTYYWCHKDVKNSNCINRNDKNNEFEKKWQTLGGDVVKSPQISKH